MSQTIEDTVAGDTAAVVVGLTIAVPFTECLSSVSHGSKHSVNPYISFGPSLSHITDHTLHYCVRSLNTRNFQLGQALSTVKEIKLLCLQKWAPPFNDNVAWGK